MAALALQGAAHLCAAAAAAWTLQLTCLECHSNPNSRKQSSMTSLSSIHTLHVVNQIGVGSEHEASGMQGRSGQGSWPG